MKNKQFSNSVRVVLGKLLLKWMRYNIALLSKNVTNYVTLLLFMESDALRYFLNMSRAWLFVFNIYSYFIVKEE